MPRRYEENIYTWHRLTLFGIHFLFKIITDGGFFYINHKYHFLFVTINDIIKKELTKSNAKHDVVSKILLNNINKIYLYS